MKIVTFQLIEEAQPRLIIVECSDTDSCPSCGAGYKVGLSACEYCKTPVNDTKATQLAQ